METFSVTANSDMNSEVFNTTALTAADEANPALGPTRLPS
jgi:hypothetical protein